MHAVWLVEVSRHSSPERKPEDFEIRKSFAYDHLLSGRQLWVLVLLILAFGREIVHINYDRNFS